MGANTKEAVKVDAAVKAEISRMTPMIPLHHPAMLQAIEDCQARIPRAIHVAVFDTSFHRHIPDKAAIYGLPYKFFSERGTAGPASTAIRTNTCPTWQRGSLGVRSAI